MSTLAPTVTVAAQRSISAAGPSAGFLFQLARALDWFSRAKNGDLIGIETSFGDIAHLSSSDITVEEDKNSVRAGHAPFGDRSVDLWKTLRNWLSAISSLDASNRTIELHMVTNRQVRGKLARMVALAQSEDEVAEVITRLQKIGKTPSAEIRGFVEEVISHPRLRDLIPLIRLYDGADPGEPAVEQTLISRLHLSPDLDHKVIIQGLLGWLQMVCSERWSANELAWISTEAFNRQLHHLTRLQSQFILIRSLCDIIIPPDEKNSVKDAVFVQQIRLLEFPDDTQTILDAITDFLAAREERRRLAVTGERVQSEYERFINELFDRFRRFHTQSCRELDRQAADYRINAIKAGRDILNATMEHCGLSLGGAEVPQYLSCGEYHRLANSAERVGWHPDYRKLLQSTLEP